MMGELTRVILQDGRTVKTEECLSIYDALAGGALAGRDDDARCPEIVEDRAGFYLLCRCCESTGEHPWSPSGQGVDPDEGHFSCSPCCGDGSYKIQMP